MLTIYIYIYAYFFLLSFNLHFPLSHQSPQSFIRFRRLAVWAHCVLCTRGKLIEKKCGHGTAVKRIGRLDGVSVSVYLYLYLYMLDIIMFRVNYKIIHRCMSAHPHTWPNVIQMVSLMYDIYVRNRPERRERKKKNNKKKELYVCTSSEYQLDRSWRKIRGKKEEEEKKCRKLYELLQPWRMQTFSFEHFNENNFNLPSHGFCVYVLYIWTSSYMAPHFGQNVFGIKCGTTKKKNRKNKNQPPKICICTVSSCGSVSLFPFFWLHFLFFFLHML